MEMNHTASPFRKAFDLTPLVCLGKVVQSLPHYEIKWFAAEEWTYSLLSFGNTCFEHGSEGCLAFCPLRVESTALSLFLVSICFIKNFSCTFFAGINRKFKS